MTDRRSVRYAEVGWWVAKQQREAEWWAQFACPDPEVLERLEATRA